MDSSKVELAPATGEKKTAFKSGFQAMHSDGGHSRIRMPYIAIRCDVPSSNGGINRILSVHELYSALREKYPEHNLLSCKFQLVTSRFVGERHLFSIRDSKLVMNWPAGFRSIGTSNIRDAEIIRTMLKLMHDPRLGWHLTLRPSDILFWNNERFVHARAPFTGYRCMTRWIGHTEPKGGRAKGQGQWH